MKKLLLSMLAFVAMAVNAAEVQVTFDGTGTSWTSSAAAQTETKDGVTLAVSNGMYSEQYRFYKNQTVTISTTEGTIKSVEFTCTANGTAKYGPGCLGDASVGTYTYEGKIGTWTDIDEASATIIATKDQVRATKVVVTIEKEVDETEPVLKADLANVYLWNYTTTAWKDYQVNEKTINITAANLTEDITYVMESSGAKKGSNINGSSTRFEVGNLGVYENRSGAIFVRVTSKEPGTFEDAILVKSGDLEVRIPVTLKVAGTEGDGYYDPSDFAPLTVADALAIHDIMPANVSYMTDETHKFEASDNGERCVRGVVVSVAEISAQYGNATFDIADETGSTKTFTVFRCKDLENANFTSEDAIAVGDTVAVAGDLCDYNGTAEIKTCYLVEYTKGTNDPTPVLGTEDNPYTVEQVKAVYAAGTAPTDKVWVKGVIVGSAKSGTALEENPVNSNIAIGTTDEWIPVQLPSGTVREAINLVDHPEYLNKEVMVYGNIVNYFSVAGIKNVTDYKIEQTATSINNATAQADNAIYNLQGQRMEKLQKGINIVGGKKIMVK